MGEYIKIPDFIVVDCGEIGEPKDENGNLTGRKDFSLNGNGIRIYDSRLKTTMKILNVDMSNPSAVLVDGNKGWQINVTNGSILIKGKRTPGESTSLTIYFTESVYTAMPPDDQASWEEYTQSLFNTYERSHPL